MKLIVVDPHVTRKSPSMRAWVEAFPTVRGLFGEVEFWATESEIPEGDGVTWKRIPRRFPTWPLQAMDFQQRVSRLAGTLVGSADTIVQATGCIVPHADIRYIHYWNRALLEEHARRKETFPLPWLKKIPAMLAARSEDAAVRNARATDHWWVVSRSLGTRIESDGAAGHFHTLPNQYDPSRFNPTVRDQWRDRMREEYGFQPQESVLAFSAFGHFERKGLRQAVEAVAILREMGHSVRFLILGGNPTTVERFRKVLTPAQREACVFAGLVDSIERHLVAADGFFFPSHFEAFSLAEIEAAALGLRLYLTPHYGSEMIMREPENGRMLPWNVRGMAEIIDDDIRQGRLGVVHHQLGEALAPEAYAEKLRSLYLQAIQSKLDPAST